MFDRLYRQLYRIRRVEEEIARVYPTDKIKSPVHLSIGQEAVSVGVCDALRQSDVAFGTYRGHALYLAKGGDLRKMVAELYGKATGCTKGKGGSMHLIDIDAGVMGTSAVVGTTIPQAVGYAYAMKVQRRDTVVASFFGDGSVEEGAFHESLNFAALKQVPAIFICENNGLSIHSRQLARQPRANIWERAASYGIRSQRIEGNDVLEIRAAVDKAAAEIRAGGDGPFFLECMTYRWKEHVGPNDDFQAGYRTREEAEPWMQNDQVVRIGDMLDGDVRTRIQTEVEAEVADAFEFAEQSPLPDEGELYTDMYKEP
jgi:TPP-dependent pyruvate/acetoin dehydrogenase alpha subunit